MKSAPPCGSVRKSWECCISVTGCSQNDPTRIAFLSRGGCHSSLTAADREQSRRACPLRLRGKSLPVQEGRYLLAPPAGNPTPTALLSDVGAPGLVSAAGF